MFVASIKFCTDGCLISGSAKCLMQSFFFKMSNHNLNKVKTYHTNSSRLTSWWKDTMTRFRAYLRRLFGRSTSNEARIKVLQFDESITAAGTKRRELTSAHTSVFGANST